MSSMTLVLLLTLATALNTIMAAPRGALLRSTASLTGIEVNATVPSTRTISSIIYELIDNNSSSGNGRFGEDIGLLYGLETLESASQFVFNVLYGGQKPQGKDYCLVLAIIGNFSDPGIGGYPVEIANTVENTIHINSDYILNFDGDVRSEFTGIMYHESSRIWQCDGNGTAPDGLITGIADYVRLKAGWPSKNWGERGSGNRWDQGYSVTAYFLEYLNGIREGSVAVLNAMMTYYYSDRFFEIIFAQTVDDLWSQYKIFYELPPPAPAPAL